MQILGEGVTIIDICNLKDLLNFTQQDATLSSSFTQFPLSTNSRSSG